MPSLLDLKKSNPILLCTHSEHCPKRANHLIKGGTVPLTTMMLKGTPVSFALVVSKKNESQDIDFKYDTYPILNFSQTWKPTVETYSKYYSSSFMGLYIAHPAYSQSSNDDQEWTFVSIPDFLNFDIEYPQEGWEDALGYIMESMKKEDPAFALVAGDLVMGHWGTTRKEIDQWADKYFPQWIKRFGDHQLRVYTALGDHEIGDNPWRGEKAAAVPFYKKAFLRHLKMPLNGPEHMLGTAFYWLHKNALFVSVDVFEEGNSEEGEIAAGVTGKQLQWLQKVLSSHWNIVDHIIVMGHTPILRPVRKFSSSGMLLEKGHESELWKTMVKYKVDLYIAGEVHAVTCTQRDGIQQVAHGGLIGRTTKPNYMVVTVSKDKLRLEIKEIDLINGKGMLWQQDKSKGPFDTITITDERKETGFTSIGSVMIKKNDNKKMFENQSGFFDEKSNPIDSN